MISLPKLCPEPEAAVTLVAPGLSRLMTPSTSGLLTLRFGPGIGFYSSASLRAPGALLGSSPLLLRACPTIFPTSHRVQCTCPPTSAPMPFRPPTFHGCFASVHASSSLRPPERDGRYPRSPYYCPTGNIMLFYSCFASRRHAQPLNSIASRAGSSCRK